MSKCPVPGCSRNVQRNKLMCLGHWRRVPADLTARVYDTWHQRRMALKCKLGRAQLAAAAHHHRLACQAASDAVAAAERLEWGLA